MQENTLIGTIARLSKEFKVQYQFKLDLSKIFTNWQNVLEFRIADGSRLIALYVPQSVSDILFEVSLFQAINIRILTKSEVDGKWVTIEYSQAIDEDGKYIRKIL